MSERAAGPELPDLLDPRFLKALEGLHLVAGKLFSGALRGERQLRRRGPGSQFLDYRKYSPGDDLRYLDWNIYGRLGEPFVKEFEAEEGARVLLVLDRSASMGFGAPSKLEYARRIAAALGYIGLRHLDRVAVVPIPGGRAEGNVFRGPGQALDLFQALGAPRAEGQARLRAALLEVLRREERSGLCVILSDFFDPEGVERSLELLARHRYRAFCVHVVDREEASPQLLGELRLVDLETGERLEVGSDRALLRDYAAAFRRHGRRVEEACRARGAGYLRVPTTLAFDAAVLRVVRRGGIAR